MDKYEEEPYTAGLTLNPKLINLNIDIIGYNENDQCSLVVRNFSDLGVGNYNCEHWKSGIVYVLVFAVDLKSKCQYFFKGLLVILLLRYGS